jgi:glycosyltransferase involved in cell wall biosynthesis
MPISLSIAAPAYNEAEGIETIILQWYEFLKKQPSITQFEIIICNDGSSDQTGLILDRVSTTHPEIIPLHFTSNQGAAAALATAIQKTRFDWVLLMDSDGQFPIEDFPKLLEQLTKNQAQAAIGTRQKKDTFFARFGTKMSAAICNLVHGSRVKDFNSAFKLVYGPLLRSLTLEAKGMNYSTEITSRLLERGVLIIDVDINHRPRKMGTSSMKLVRGSIHRALFVFYISLRQLLLKCGVLRQPH